MSSLSKEEKVTTKNWFSLTDNEEVVHAEHPSIWTTIPTIALSVLSSLAGLAVLVLFYDTHDMAILAGILLFIGGIGAAVIVEIKRRHQWYILTNERIMKKHGWYSWDTRETRYDKIQDVTVRVSVKERLMGYGDVEVTTSGTKSTEFRIHDIPNPADISNQISVYKDKAIERGYTRNPDEDDA